MRARVPVALLLVLGLEELFATLSAAWLGVSDHYPFVRAELKVHDPESFGLIERLWAPPGER